MSHFAGKDVLSHVNEKRALGACSRPEVHGRESPGHISAFADALQETGVVFLLLAFIIFFSSMDFGTVFPLFCAFALGWIVWKTGRSARLAFSRLEYLHRLIEQEKHEIEHNRSEEREELLALYRKKGFEGRLLEECVDVLMSDQDRLLSVMLEEELGLTLNIQEHPLKQALGAFLGALLASIFWGVLVYFFHLKGAFIATASLLTVSCILIARFENNKKLATLIWTLSIALLAASSTYFLLK